MTLKGFNIIISGGSQGLGFEVAKQFVMAGANVMICARNIEQLVLAQKNLSLFANKNKVLICPTDISSPAQISDLIANTLSELGTIDVLVANAGIYGTKGPIDEIDWQEWSDAIDINLKGNVCIM